MSVPAPIAGGEIWQAVMTRAGDRCECQGACGSRHPEDDHPDIKRRCVRTGTNARPLHAVPRGAETWPAAARLPADRLIAMCDHCHAGIERRRRRTTRTETPDMPTLFD